jgi:hypothetical protein
MDSFDRLSVEDIKIQVKKKRFYNRETIRGIRIL